MIQLRCTTFLLALSSLILLSSTNSKKSLTPGATEVNAVFAMHSKSKKKKEKHPYKVSYQLSNEEEMLATESESKGKDRLRYYQDDISSAQFVDNTFQELQDNRNLVVMELKEIGKDNIYRPLCKSPLQYDIAIELKTGF
ncbi:hypothetical protein [Nonlabens marinus]|uniref:Uncharacterized protein n=1 Tax=Nonlabens marinus S1-08 TaxID=1454201 RepID=W8VVX1_9FLAO|nr:hypothetical protein [Nonlabens marinus]BAO55828.1 hypothetical protein NMS_1819 [Nonlabens marinus S1-08]